MQSREGWRLLEVGREIALETEAPLFRGIYQVTVLELKKDAVLVSLPSRDGHLVFLPVGLSVRIILSHNGEQTIFNGMVCSRQTGERRSLTLSWKEPAAFNEREEPEEHPDYEPAIPVWAVTSGKGGVGKTTAVVNFALALAERGRRVCIIDADLGTANVDVVLNLTPRYTLAEVISGRKHILEALVEGPGGIIILPGGSGLQELTQLRDSDFQRLLAQFRELESFTDIILIDTSSGLSKSVTNFIAAAQMGILITTPEPPAITDAYALIKVLARAGHIVPIKLVINRAKTATEAENTMEKIVFAAKKFLHYELTPLGFISDDEYVEKAVREQVALIKQYPRCKAAQDFYRLAALLDNSPKEKKDDKQQPGGIRGFLKRFKDMVRKEKDD